MSSLCANSWSTTLCPCPGSRRGRVRLVPRDEDRAAPLVRLAEDRQRTVGHGAGDRPGPLATRLHRARVHDDRAHLAQLVDVEAEHEEPGLHRDRDGDGVVELEAERGLPVLVPEQPVGVGGDGLALVVVEQPPDRDVRLDEVDPVVGEPVAAVEHARSLAATGGVGQRTG